MKINPVGQSEAISKYVSSASSTSSKGSLSASISDSVELSEGAQKYSSIMKAAKEAMDKAGVDEEIRADDIMKCINEGSYQVSSKDVVNDILSGYPSKG